MDKTYVQTECIFISYNIIETSSDAHFIFDLRFDKECQSINNEVNFPQEVMCSSYLHDILTL